MKKIFLFLIINISLISFGQVKKAAPVFNKYYEEYLTDFKKPEVDFGYYLPKFHIGITFDNTTVTQKPEVEYNKKFDFYEYVYKLDDANYIIWVKNGKVIRNQFVVYSLNHYSFLFNFFDLKDKSFVSGKGFKISDQEYLVVSKDRHDKYDSYTFDHRSLDYYMLQDLANSSK